MQGHRGEEAATRGELGAMAGRYQDRKVFISYSRDDAEYARTLFQHFAEFRSEGGTVFFDADVLLPGANWQAELRGALDDANAFVMLVSAASINSGYCWKDELQVFMDRFEHGDGPRVPIFLFLLEDVAWQGLRVAGDVRLGDLQITGPYQEDDRPTYLKRIPSNEHSEHYRKVIKDLYAYFGRHEQATQVRTTRAREQRKPIPRDACIAFIDKDCVDQIEAELDTREPGEVAVVTVSGTSTDWHDALRLRSQHGAASRVASLNKILPMTWKTAAELGEAAQWSHLWKRLGSDLGLANPDPGALHDAKAAGFKAYADGLAKFAAGHGARLTINYEMTQSLWAKADKQRFTRFFEAWQALGNAMPAVKVGLLLSIIEVEGIESPGWWQSVRGAEVLSAALLKSQLSDYRDGPASINALAQITRTDVDEWDHALRTVFKVDDEERRLELRRAAVHCLGGAQAPHGELKANLNMNDDFRSATN